MASRARWDPFREIEQLQNELSRLVGSAGREERGGRTHIPPADVWETDQEVVYAFDLPGVSEDRISIELEDGTLTITAEREPSPEMSEERVHRRERRFGTFSRTISLPQGTGEQAIGAHCENGVLEVRVRKPEEPKPRRIEIGKKQA